MWGTENLYWKDVNFWWSRCPIQPNPVILQPVGVDASQLIQPWNPYKTVEGDKKKRLIKLICKIKGQTYEEEKEIGTMKVSIDDVKTAAGVDINLDVKLKEQ